MIVVLALELVYRLVALPPDYREQRLAEGAAETSLPGPVPQAVDAGTPVDSGPTVDSVALATGLRINRRLESAPPREVARLAGDLEHLAGRLTEAAPFGTMADPALAAVAAVPPVATAAEPAAGGIGLVALPSVRPPAGTGSGDAPLVAIIIDDMGYSPASLTRLGRLPGPLTLAFLPYADATKEMLARAKGGDFELMLHLPMEPLGDADPGPEALLVGLEPDELRRRVRWAIGEVPGAVGVNNHMGSRFSADAAGLEVVMAELRRHGLYFLDSRTNPASLAERRARAAGLPASARNVFLDHDPDQGAIDRQLALVERIARRNGDVIAIGHPYPTTLAALEAWLPGLERRGFRLARVSEVIALRLCREAGRRQECGPGLYLVGGDAALVPQEAGEAAP